MKTIGLFFLLTLAALTHGQTFKVTGTVIDSEKEEALPYANIVILGKSLGTSANSNGYFELLLPSKLKNDSIVISYAGYKPRIIRLDKAASEPIQLEQQNIGQYELAVTNSEAKIKPLTINKFSKKRCTIRYNSNDSVKGFHLPQREIEPTIEALYYPFKNEYREYRWLKEIGIAVSNYNIGRPAIFRVHIYKVTNDLKPGDDLLTESLIVKTSEQEDIIKIDIEKYNIEMPSNGLFIGFELLIIEENKLVLSPNKEEATASLYSPYLNYIESEEKVSFGIYSKGKWNIVYQINPYPSENRTLYYKPAISLVVSN